MAKVNACRKSSIDSWIELLQNANVNVKLITFVNNFMETHTTEENEIMMKAFLNKVRFTLDVSIVGEDYEHDYCNALNCILEEEDKSRK